MDDGAQRHIRNVLDITLSGRDDRLILAARTEGGHMVEQVTDESGPSTLVLTFLIADIRGYSRFTAERGDAAAALLAKRFADLARDAVEARAGRVIELRGDEAVAVFESPSQAVRAAVEFQATCAEESEADPMFPLPVGIGIDSGEAVPLEDGYRGLALNMAARLCSSAAAGQVLVTRTFVGSDESANDGITFVERGPATFKGFEQAVDVIEAVAGRAGAPPRVGPELEPTKDQVRGIPAELDPLTPLVERVHEMRWLRGTWRIVRRGGGRVLFVLGPAQIGKTRLAGEIAAHVHADGGVIRYAGPGGAATAMALSEIRRALHASSPTLLVLDDIDVAGPQVAEELAASLEELSGHPVLVLALLRAAADADLARLIERADERGDGHRGLAPLDIDGVRGIVRLYVGQDESNAPVESIARASHGVPGRVHEVVSEWARSEASRRLAAAAEFLAAGRDRHASDLEFANNVIGLKLGSLYSIEGRDVLAVETCPYKGLAAFERDDSDHFFGRERLVGELAARTVQVGLLGVVGASGSGKSSVIAAGLLPSLGAGLLPGSENWKQVAIRPGEHPMNVLRTALSSEAEDPIEAAVEALTPEGRVVLVVDQFEETFTVCAGEAERSDFVDALIRAAKRWPENVAVVLAIRGDFYGHCGQYPDLAEVLAANHVLVGPLTSEELKRAIELPARRAGLRVESVLVDALVEEVSDEPGGLPLLSTALVELWQAREDGWIRMEAHERTGGVRGAVSRLAETSYEQLSAAEQVAARRVFLRLVASGEGETVTRRRVELDEFDLARDPDAAAVLTRLTQDRLLTKTEDMVEVAHEALLREWPRLRAWLEEDMQGHQLRQHLTHAAQQWEDSGRDAFEVYRGARLSAALDWAATRGPDLNEQERDFLSESRQASEREADKQRRTNRRLRGLLGGTAVFLVVALLAGGLALVQRGRARDEAVRAESQARIATARALAAAAVANLDVDPERSILLALAAVDATWKVDRTVEGEAEEALHRALQESRVVLTVPQGRAIAVSADGTRFATTGEDGTATVWETDTGTRLLTLRGHEEAVNGIAFSPDGSLLATAGSDRTVRLWDAASGRQVHVMRGHRDVVGGAAFSPDGSLLATSSKDDTVRIWDVAAGMQYLVLRGPRGEELVNFSDLTPAFSPDGSRVTSGGWFSTPIWDLATGRISTVLPSQTPQAVAFSPDGARVATSAHLDAQTWDAQTGKPLTTLSGHTGDVLAVAYSPDGRRIATSANDGTARVWDAETGEPVLTLAGHTRDVKRVAFTPDGDRLLTGAADGTTRLWDISPTGGRDWLTVPGPEGRQSGVAFSPDGTSFAVPGQVSGVTIRDVNTGARIISLEGHDATIRRMAFSPDGTRLAGSDGITGEGFRASSTVPVWDVTTGKLVMTLRGHASPVVAVAYSPDGRRLATTSYDGTVRLWDALSGNQLHAVDVGKPWAVGFSPDGRWLVSDDRAADSLIVWDADTLERQEELRGHTADIQDVAFGPDGTVVTASFDNTAKIWDLESGRDLATLEGHTGPILGVAVSSDGTLVATGSLDGSAKLWDLSTGREVLTLFGHEAVVNTVAFSPDGRYLATVSGDGTVALHLLPIDELRELAATRVTRSLTEEECRQYLHVGKCPGEV